MKNYSFETGANITLLPLKLNSGKTSDNYAYKNKSTQFKTDRNLFAIIGLGAAAVTGEEIRSRKNHLASIYLPNAEKHLPFL